MFCGLVYNLNPGVVEGSGLFEGLLGQTWAVWGRTLSIGHSSAQSEQPGLEGRWGQVQLEMHKIWSSIISTYQYYILLPVISLIFCSSFQLIFLWGCPMQTVMSSKIEFYVYNSYVSHFFPLVQMCWLIPQCEKVVLTMGKPILIYSGAKKIK